MAGHFLLRGASRVAKLAERNAELLVQLIEALDSTVEVDRLLMTSSAKLADNPLRFAKRISADQNAPARVGMEALQQSVDLTSRPRMPEHRKSECRLGDEDIAGDRDEAGASWVGPSFVISGDHDLFALVLEDDLRRAEYVPGGHEADAHVANAEAFVICGDLPVLPPATDVHDCQRFGCRQHRSMSTTRMVGVAVRDHCLGLWL